MNDLIPVTYMTVTYEQIWSSELWLSNTAPDAIARVFDEFPQIGWLVELGYRPNIQKWHNIQSDNMHIAYQFSVREQDLTYLLIRWPQSSITIDYDRMTTKLETING